MWKLWLSNRWRFSPLHPKFYENQGIVTTKTAIAKPMQILIYGVFFLKDFMILKNFLDSWESWDNASIWWWCWWLWWWSQKLLLSNLLLEKGATTNFRSPSNFCCGIISLFHYGLFKCLMSLGNNASALLRFSSFFYSLISHNYYWPAGQMLYETIIFWPRALSQKRCLTSGYQGFESASWQSRNSENSWFWTSFFLWSWSQATND